MSVNNCLNIGTISGAAGMFIGAFNFIMAENSKQKKVALATMGVSAVIFAAGISMLESTKVLSYSIEELKSIMEKEAAVHCLKSTSEKCQAVVEKCSLIEFFYKRCGQVGVGATCMRSNQVCLNSNLFLDLFQNSTLFQLAKEYEGVFSEAYLNDVAVGSSFTRLGDAATELFHTKAIAWH